jgi:hypothetical protein
MNETHSISPLRAAYRDFVRTEPDETIRQWIDESTRLFMRVDMKARIIKGLNEIWGARGEPGRIREMTVNAGQEFVWELVFSHPPAEWTARLAILADYYRDSVPNGWESGEMLGEILDEGFAFPVEADA